jgi:hypothetical protein
VPRTSSITTTGLLPLSVPVKFSRPAACRGPSSTGEFARPGPGPARRPDAVASRSGSTGHGPGRRSPARIRPSADQAQRGSGPARIRPSADQAQRGSGPVDRRGDGRCRERRAISRPACRNASTTRVQKGHAWFVVLEVDPRHRTRCRRAGDPRPGGPTTTVTGSSLRRSRSNSHGRVTTASRASVKTSWVAHDRDEWISMILITGVVPDRSPHPARVIARRARGRPRRPGSKRARARCRAHRVG